MGNGVETEGFSFRFPSTFNGKQNRVVVYFATINTATNINDRPQRIRLRKNAAFTSPVWTDFDAGVSVIQVLTGGSWDTGTGDLIEGGLLAGGGEPTLIKFDTENNNNILGLKDETFTFTFEGIGGAGGNSGLITWIESQ